MHKILWYFELQMDYLIPVRRSDQVLINKKKWTYHLVDFEIQTDNQIPAWTPDLV